MLATITLIVLIFLILIFMTVADYNKRWTWVIRMGSILIVFIAVCVWSFGIFRVKNNCVGDLLMTCGIGIVMGTSVFVHYTYRYWVFDQTQKEKELFRVFNLATTLVIVCFKVVGPVFRPKWYITLLVSSILFTFTRTVSIYFVEVRDPLQLAATAVFSMIICAVGDSFAYTMRWVLVRSFVF